MGFGRACASVRCAHPTFWAHCHAQRGAARPPPIEDSLLPQKPEKKSFPSGPNLGRQGRIFFHCAKLHPTELHCILQSYAAPVWAPLHPPELRCTQLCCAEFIWAMPQRTQSELSCTLWAKLHPSDLRCALLSYAAPYLSLAASQELLWTLRATLQPSELHYILLCYDAPYWATLILNELRGTSKI